MRYFEFELTLAAAEANYAVHNPFVPRWGGHRIEIDDPLAPPFANAAVELREVLRNSWILGVPQFRQQRCLMLAPVHSAFTAVLAGVGAEPYAVWKEFSLLAPNFFHHFQVVLCYQQGMSAPIFSQG
jgi:hypothetical protein